MAKTKIALLYERLSRDDELSGESFSIQNQDGICQGYFHPLKIPTLSIHHHSSRFLDF